MRDNECVREQYFSPDGLNYHKVEHRVRFMDDRIIRLGRAKQLHHWEA